MQEQIAIKLSRSSRQKLRSLEYAYIAKSSARRLLVNELREARKRTLKDEDTTTIKRLKKQDDNILTSARDVFKAKGYSEEETEMYLSVLPNRESVYNVQGAPDI